MSVSMERSRGREVAVVEFVQAERGEHVTKDFFHGLRRLCSKHGASFYVDEEQSGAWWMVVDADGRRRGGSDEVEPRFPAPIRNAASSADLHADCMLPQRQTSGPTDRIAATAGR